MKNDILKLTAVILLLLSSALAYADRIILDEKFNSTKSDLKNWKFTPEKLWDVVKPEGVNGDGALRVSGDNGVKRCEAYYPIKFAPGAPVNVRLSVWLKTERVNYRRDAIVEIEFKADGYSQVLREFNRNTSYTYLEKLFTVPAGLHNPVVSITFYGLTGSAFVDEIKVDEISGNQNHFMPYQVTAKPVLNEKDPWLANLPYRITGKIDADYNNNDPVWADLDFSRLLLAAGEFNPVDPSSVKVFARDLATGKTTNCPVSFGDPLSNLSDHYMHNGLLKWRAVKGLKSYEIYFAPSGANGPLPQKANLNMGVGELLSYADDQKNLLWGGWPGAGLQVVDVDGDGDWDIYSKSNDGDVWLCRNISSNKSPLFLPRSRPLASDMKPAFLPDDIFIDWDGDGLNDRVFYERVPRANRLDNIVANVYIQFNRKGALAKPVPLTYLNGKPVQFTNGSWFDMQTGDFNNDGKPDLIVGSTNGYADILLNNGTKNEKPIVAHEKLVFDVFKNAPSESGDMSLKFAPVDWNGDGKTDLVITGWQGFYWVAINTGKTRELKFEKPKVLYQQGGVMVHNDSSSPYAVDWDNDGDMDIISGGCSGNLMYFENIAGKGNPPQFKAGEYVKDETNQPIFINTVDIGGDIQGLEEQYWGYLTCVPADVDHDGDLDLIIADCLGRVRWIENIGSREKPILSKSIHRFYVNGHPLITPWRNRPGVADWDKDKRLKLVLLNEASELVFYKQDAKDPSVFTNSGKLKDTEGNSIIVKRPPPSMLGANGRCQIEVGDWNGDGNLDLIIGGPRMYTGGGNLSICINKGTNANPVFQYKLLPTRNARFVEWTGSDGHDAWHCTYPCLVDWNNDGKPGIMTGTESGRFVYYAHEYFEGEKFPVFTAQNFEKRDGKKKEALILDFNHLTPATQGLNTQNIQLQLLPEEVNPTLFKKDGAVKIASPKSGVVVKGKVPFIATTEGNPVIVEFYINNEKVATERIPPYVAFGDDSYWDTTKLPDGECELKAVVTFFDGHKAETSQKNIINNKGSGK